MHVRVPKHQYCVFLCVVYVLCLRACVHTIYRTDLVGGLASLMEAFLLAPAELVILD